MPKYLRILIPSLLIVIWFIVAGVGGPYFGKIGDVSSNDQTTFLPASAESTQVNKEIEKFQDESTIPATIVFTNKDKTDINTKTSDKIEESIAGLTDIKGIVGDVSPPIVSDDKKAALAVISMASDADYKAVVAQIKDTINDSGLSMDYKISGPVGFLNDLAGAFSGIDSLLLIVALSVVFVILLIVYRSPVLPIFVLINSMLALCAAILFVYYLAKLDILTLNGQVQGILFILVIGAATDYALLFVSRYREELTKQKENYQALLRSWKRSVEPILAAGGTVIAGLLCLLLSDLNSNKALGPVGAIGIAMAIVATMTFLPSLFLLMGRKVFWPFMPKYMPAAKHDTSPPKQSIWAKVSQLIKQRSRSVWIVTTVVLLAATAGLTQINADGVPQSEFVLGASEARDGQKIISQHFPDGSGAPMQIVASSDKLGDIVAALDKDSGVDSVTAAAVDSPSGSVPLGKQADSIKKDIRDKATKELASQKKEIRSDLESKMKGAPSFAIDKVYERVTSNLPSVDDIVSKAYLFEDATPKAIDGEVLLQATLVDDADSRAAQESVERVRTSLHDIDQTARVGGTSAVQLDTLKSAERDRLVVIPAVLIVITIILVLLLRSVLMPLILLCTTVLSFAAILGISSVVFNNVFNFPGADPSVVLYGFVFLVALGIDYNIFLMTRVREESLRVGTRKGVLIGLVATGSVITSAGIVLAATFASLVVIPILFLVQLAFIVAVGVLIDTIIIRSLLVPAITYDIGKHAWWPSKRHNN